MFFTWVRGFERHILAQSFKSWLYFLTMGVLFWFLPALIQSRLGVPPTERAQNIFNYYHYVVACSFFVALISLESFGRYLRIHRVKPHEEFELQMRVRDLAQRAGLSQVPVITMLKGRMNAATTTTLFSRSYIIAMGPLTEALDAREEDAVFAHEIAHLKHRDMFARTIINAGAYALRFQLVGLGLVTLWGVIAIKWRGAGEVGYVGSAWMCTYVTYLIYHMFSLAHSRAREYLADVGAIGLLDEDYRDELICGVLKIATLETHRHPLSVMKRTGLGIFLSHPEVADRARALGVTVRANRDGGIVFTESKVA